MSQQEPSPSVRRPREVRKVAGFSEEQGYFEHVIDQEATPKFLTFQNGAFHLLDGVVVRRRTCLPKTELVYLPYVYEPNPKPEAIKPLALYMQVYREFDDYLDLEADWKHFLTTCTLMSYQQEKLQTVPYVFPFGDNESGKTTILNVFSALCYRPVLGIAINSADLYTYLEDSDYVPTILEDEIEGIERDNDKLKVYRSGYKKGAKVPRIINLPHARVIKYYNTFCFKAVTSERLSPIRGFNERFVFIPMSQGFPSKEWADNTDEDQLRFDKIRGMLLKWRLMTRGQRFAPLEVPPWLKGRMKELWKPVLLTAQQVDPPVFHRLLEFAKAQLQDRLSMRQNTLEGQLVKVVASLYRPVLLGQRENFDVAFGEIWFGLLHELEGSTDDRRENVMNTPEYGDVTKQRLGYRLREILGGTKKSLRQGNEVMKAYSFDIEKLRRIVKKYGYLVTELPSLPTLQGIHVPSRPSEEPNLDSFSETKGDLGE